MRTVEILSMSAATALLDCVIKANIKKPLITKNRGFAHNRFDKYPNAVAAVSLLLTAGLLQGVISGRKDSSGYALLLGGALSNTYERVFKGYVTDYIRIGRTVYNISDFAIFAGVLILVVQSIFEEKEAL